LNFKHLGVDNLQASKAFKQIRANSRVYTSNLTGTISPFTSKYIKLNSLFKNDVSISNTNSFGLKHPITLTSASTTTAINQTFLDSQSLKKFLNYNLQYNHTSSNNPLFNKLSDL